MLRKMMMRAGALAALVALFAAPGIAQAHETRPVGTYEFVVGWNVEPAYQGQKNGVDLRVRIPAEGDAEPTPVEGVEETLEVEVTHLASGQTVTMALSTIFGTPGRYIAHMIPTVSGQYEFRFFGTVEGTQIDETFTSGERFDNINPTDEIQFPEKVAEVREVQGVASEALEAADDADSAASSAQTLSYVAIGLAVLAGAGAVGAFVMNRR